MEPEQRRLVGSAVAPTRGSLDVAVCRQHNARGGVGAGGHATGSKAVGAYGLVSETVGVVGGLFPQSGSQ